MKPVDIIALMITATLCWMLVLVSLQGWSPWFLMPEGPPEKLDAVKATIASLITIISLYVGHKIKGKDE